MIIARPGRWVDPAVDHTKKQDLISKADRIQGVPVDLAERKPPVPTNKIANSPRNRMVRERHQLAGHGRTVPTLLFKQQQSASITNTHQVTLLGDHGYGFGNGL